MPANPLSMSEREEIRVGIELGQTDGLIAERLERDRTTINREINTNGGRFAYSADAAHARAASNRARPKIPRLVADRALAAMVESRLEALDSPMRISIELAHNGLSISHECIYQAIYRPNWGLPKGLGKRCLHLKRRRRKPRNGHVAATYHPLGVFTSIHDRPEIATRRDEVGHFEGDLIVGAYNRSAIMTLFDRMSRNVWLTKTSGKSADAAHDALIETFERIPPAIRLTLTWDQGTEMARHLEIAQTCGIPIFFADPKSPWQRPTNEAGNTLVRRYVGKGTDLNTYSTKDLRRIEHRINTIPRRIHNWATAHHTYTAAVAMTD